jgi:hypothetical protein
MTFILTNNTRRYGMGLFNRKPKIIKEISGGTWGHLVSVHGITVDILSNDIRCVDKAGTLDKGIPVTLIRVFRLSEVAKKGITVTGWETFDQNPDLILFEGYFNEQNNEAHLERKEPKTGSYL